MITAFWLEGNTSPRSTPTIVSFSAAGWSRCRSQASARQARIQPRFRCRCASGNRKPGMSAPTRTPKKLNRMRSPSASPGRGTPQPALSLSRRGRFPGREAQGAAGPASGRQRQRARTRGRGRRCPAALFCGCNYAPRGSRPVVVAVAPMLLLRSKLSRRYVLRSSGSVGRCSDTPRGCSDM